MAGERGAPADQAEIVVPRPFCQRPDGTVRSALLIAQLLSQPVLVGPDDGGPIRLAVHREWVVERTGAPDVHAPHTLPLVANRNHAALLSWLPAPRHRQRPDHQHGMS